MQNTSKKFQEFAMNYNKQNPTDLSKNEITSNTACICIQKSHITQTSRLIKCNKCQTFQHEVCMEKNAQLTPQQCPQCLLWNVDPFNEPIKILCPAYKIIAGAGNASQKRFNVDGDTIQKIKSANGKLQAQIRCLRLDGMPYEHSWPKHGWLRQNNKQLMPLTQPPENTSARKRKDEPFNVTTLVGTGGNNLEIIQQNDSDSYVGMLFLVKKKTMEEYVNEIKTNNIEDINKCIERIINVLDVNQDEIELENNNRRMSVKCPLTFALIKTPVRGKHCTHLDCFNLDTYAQVNLTTKAKKWKCPICNITAQEIVVDEQWVQILEEARKVEDAEEVEVQKDGGFRIITFKESKARGLGKLQEVMASANKTQIKQQEKIYPKIPEINTSNSNHNSNINNKRKVNNEDSMEKIITTMMDNSKKHCAEDNNNLAQKPTTSFTSNKSKVTANVMLNSNTNNNGSNKNCPINL